MYSIEKQIRRLARSSYWQNIYRASKEVFGVKLFENTSNFSASQYSFLYWLRIYDLLYTELSQHEDDFLSEEVIKDDIRCTAYLYYRNKKHDYFWKKRKQEEKVNEIRSRQPKKHTGKKTNVIDVDLRSA